MEPITPNDPIWKLLGKARPVEPRGNFTQNVMRAVRGMPQERGAMPAIRAWFAETFGTWQRQALAGAAVAAFVLVVGLVSQTASTSSVSSSAVVATAPTQLDADMALIAEDADLPLEGLDHMDALVAMEDTSALTDKEIAFLLY